MFFGLACRYVWLQFKYSSVIARGFVMDINVLCGDLSILTSVSLHRTTYNLAHFFMNPFSPNPITCYPTRIRRKDQPVVRRPKITTFHFVTLHYYLLYSLDTEQQKNSRIITAVAPKLMVSRFVWIHILPVLIAWSYFHNFYIYSSIKIGKVMRLLLHSVCFISLPGSVELNL